MKRILVGAMFTLPLIATALSKPASALEVNNNPQLSKAVGQPEYIAQYDGRYQQPDGGRYREQDRGRYQQRRTWVPGHYEYRNHRRFFVRGHYIYG
jgi:hypothetical protein